MRQLGDLLVGIAMIMALVAVLYLTPQLANYLLDDRHGAPRGAISRGLALVGQETASTTTR